jgi:hypothetical protein
MERHALAVLEQSDLWNWPITRRLQESGEQGGKFMTVTPKLLYILIIESQRFGGRVLDQFWKQLGACDEKLRNNSQPKAIITQSYRLTFICSRKSEGGGFRVGKEVLRAVISGIRSQQRQFQTCITNGGGVLYSSWCRM